MADVLSNWDQGVYGAFPVDTPQALTAVTSGRTSYTPIITRLNSTLFLVSARGQQVDAGGRILARRMLGTLARLTPTNVDVQAAVTSKGTVKVGGNATVDGNDHTPAGWTSCPAPGAPKAGVRTDGTVQIIGGGTTIGSPPTRTNDATVVDSLFTNPFNELKAMRNIDLTSESNNGMAPSATGTPLRCNKTLMLNWGEPWNPGTVAQCQGYFPVIYRNGNLKVQNGRGQGILLIEGDFEVRGNFEFTGLIIATGMLKANGTGNKITGGVLAQNADLDDIALIGNPVVNYSSCAISKALSASAAVKPLTDRSWVQLYN
jgi:hypothetical protein